MNLLQGPINCGEPEGASVKGNQRRNNALSDGSYHETLHKKARTTNYVGVNDNPNRVSEASHLNVLEVFTDGDQAYVLMEGKRLSLRLSDYHLNAYQILGIAGLDSSRRSRLLAKYKRAGIGEPAKPINQGNRPYWIPFPFGHFTTDDLGGTETSPFNDNKIVYKQAELLIDASHVCRACRLDMQAVWHNVTSQGITAVETLRANTRTQGICITFVTA
ncbi:hypothetical protein LTR12_012411 [Friedmanniomyces endolithicus]|nr:hypothetical protein LTR74_014984 [Friedmanniomyces endolithicus]KAK1813222.1 hypothetical protein LTR12_012411 [Friedmanniomyces endolithicus]